jgi:hypothetical protein
MGREVLMSKKIILSVDPGKASGICTFSIVPGEEPVLEKSGEYQMREYHIPIYETLKYAQAMGLKVEVVCERFIINAQTVRNSQAPFSLEQIGILKYIMLDCQIDPDELIFQSPSDAKKMFPNEALKKLEYWHKGGEGHAIDAIRHGLLRLVKTGWKPMRLLQ